ncbi:hypothetical protein AMTRI_Chr05g67410 [Amborella trichopoda]
MDLPLLIPVDQLPILSQPPSGSTHDSSLLLTDMMPTEFLSFFYQLWYLSLSKPATLGGSSLESMFPIQTPKQKRLIEISDCFDKPVVYQKSKIMVATMDLSKDYCKIGESVYKATIDRKYFAVKQCRGHITKEINILQKFNLAIW